MKKLIAEFRELAQECTTIAKVLRHVAVYGDTDDKEAAEETIDELRDKLRGTILPQLHALLEREPDDAVRIRLEQLEGLIEHGVEDEDEEDDDDDDQNNDEDYHEEDDDDDDDQNTGYFALWVVTFKEIQKTLMWLVAWWTTRPKSAAHQTTITGSTIGAVAVGERSHATGSNSRKAKRQ